MSIFEENPKTPPPPFSKTKKAALAVQSLRLAKLALADPESRTIEQMVQERAMLLPEVPTEHLREVIAPALLRETIRLAKLSLSFYSEPIGPTLPPQTEKPKHVLDS